MRLMRQEIARRLGGPHDPGGPAHRHPRAQPRARTVGLRRFGPGCGRALPQAGGYGRGDAVLPAPAARPPRSPGRPARPGAAGPPGGESRTVPSSSSRRRWRSPRRSIATTTISGWRSRPCSATRPRNRPFGARTTLNPGWEDARANWQRARRALQADRLRRCIQAAGETRRTCSRSGMTGVFEEGCGWEMLRDQPCGLRNTVKDM